MTAKIFVTTTKDAPITPNCALFYDENKDDDDDDDYSGCEKRLVIGQQHCPKCAHLMANQGQNVIIVIESYQLLNELFWFDLNFHQMLFADKGLSLFCISIFVSMYLYLCLCIRRYPKHKLKKL